MEGGGKLPVEHKLPSFLKQEVHGVHLLLLSMCEISHKNFFKKGVARPWQPHLPPTQTSMFEILTKVFEL